MSKKPIGLMLSALTFAAVTLLNTGRAYTGMFDREFDLRRMRFRRRICPDD